MSGARNDSGSDSELVGGTAGSELGAGEVAASSVEPESSAVELGVEERVTADTQEVSISAREAGQAFPVVLPTMLDESKRAAAEAMIAGLSPALVPDFQKFASGELASFLQLLPAMDAAATDACRDAWLVDRYYDLMESFLAEKQVPLFHPLVSANDLPDDERADFRQLCEQMRPQAEAL